MSQAHAPVAPFPASRARVLIADDSVVVRGLIARWLTESGVEVVATVSNGRSAIEALDRVDPEIVLLDLDMPELDGISALPRLLEKRPGLSVVVISTLTQRNAEISLKCLRLGAVDYLPKPGTNREVTTSMSFRQELIGKVKALSRPSRPAPGGPPSRAAGAPATRTAPARRALMLPPRCLLVGASTGGPKAIGGRPRRPGRSASANTRPDRAAYAADLHGGFRGASLGPDRDAGQGGRGWRGARCRAALCSAWRPSYEACARRRAAPPDPPRRWAAREFLPSCRRRPVPGCGRGVRRLRARRRSDRHGRRRIHGARIRIWCAAASSGQEPYSLAMLLQEAGSRLTGWDIEIVATDISVEVLEKAKAGRRDPLSPRRQRGRRTSRNRSKGTRSRKKKVSFVAISCPFLVTLRFLAATDRAHSRRGHRLLRVSLLATKLGP